MLQFFKSRVSRRGLQTAAGCLLLATSLAGLAGAESSKKAFTETELMAPAPGPNPFLGTPAAGTKVDWNYWRAKVAFEGRLHADRLRTDRTLGPESFKARVSTSEIEPNDSSAEAQTLLEFGTGEGDLATMVISASIDPSAPPTPFALAAEDDGDINSASPSGLTPGQSVTAMGQLGDGPHGSAGTARGDFDFFLISGVQAGQILSMDVRTPDPEGDLDPNCALWDSAGNLLEFHEDLNIVPGTFDFDCRLVVEAPADGDYYFSIGGWSDPGEQDSELLPADPFDSGSGWSQFPSEGTYTVTLGLDAVDRDCFTFGLVPGDILGTSSSGGDNLIVRVIDPSGELRMGSIADRTFLYPDASPMPRGGAVTNFVAVEPGDHTVCFDGRPADYGAELRVFRPILESSASRQTFFIDFDGATLERSIFPQRPDGEITLSPLSSFLTNWGLLPEDEDAVIDVVLETLTENLVDDLRTLSNPRFSVHILNSRDHEDPFGQPHVSRVVVGGSSAESGMSIVSIVQSIDPGNFDTEETALIQLDDLSAPVGFTAFYTLNSIEIAGDASKIDLVGLALGNYASQEAGHLLGLWNTERYLDGSPESIMDGVRDGFERPSPLGLGPDRIFGTSDDVDVDFAKNRFSLMDRFMGFQDTAEVLARTLSAGDIIFSDGFESGTTEAWTSSSP